MTRLLTLLLVLLGLPAMAEEIVSGLSQSRVAINANYDGTAILIYGTALRDAPPPVWPMLQVIITVEGPSSPLIIRHKERVAGLWLNRGSVRIDSAPSFYAVMSTGDMSDVLSEVEDRRYGISIPQTIHAIGARMQRSDAGDYIAALQRIRMANAAYKLAPNSILLLQQSLFRTDVLLPSDLIEGTYKVRIFLTRGGKVVDMQESHIDVRKAGLERFLFNLAQDQPLIYGLMSLVLAAVAGWGASEAFRRLRL